MTGAELHVAAGFTSDLGQVMSAHRHGAHLVLSNSTTVSIWDPDADRLVARFEGFEECIDALSYRDDIIVSQYGTGSVAGPEGIAAAEDGTLYVVEEDAGRVTQVNPQTGTATSVTDGLALSGLERRALGDSTSVGSLSGVAVVNGTLFVSDYQGNRVYRIEP